MPTTRTNARVTRVRLPLHETIRPGAGKLFPQEAFALEAFAFPEAFPETLFRGYGGRTPHRGGGSGQPERELAGRRQLDDAG